MEAVDRLDAARGVEHDLAARQVGAFVVREAQPVGDLPDLAVRDGQLVQVEVVLLAVLLPRVEHALAVVGYVRVADHARRVVQQCPDRSLARCVHLEHAQCRPRQPVAFPLSVGEGFRVGVVRAAEVPVLGEDHAANLLEVGGKALPAACFAGADVQLRPAGVFRSDLAAAERLEFLPKARCVVAQLLHDGGDRRGEGLVARDTVLEFPVFEEAGVRGGGLALRSLGGGGLGGDNRGRHREDDGQHGDNTAVCSQHETFSPLHSTYAPNIVAEVAPPREPLHAAWNVDMLVEPGKSSVDDREWCG